MLLVGIDAEYDEMYVKAMFCYYLRQSFILEFHIFFVALLKISNLTGSISAHVKEYGVSILFRKISHIFGNMNYTE